MDQPAGVFRCSEPGRYEPTAAAVGPWDASLVHGAAIAGLAARCLTPDEGTLARLTVDILGPVPMAPITVERSTLGGGRRVQRGHATMHVEQQVVATASSVVVRRADLSLPPGALEHPSPFDPAEAPCMEEPNRAAATVVGWESFDSLACAFRPTRVEGDRRTHQWVGLTMPMVEGEPLLGTELAAVAADYAQSATSRSLPFDRWSYRNAELTVHLARRPVGPWIGVRAEALVQPVGAGFNAADLFDRHGRVGRSAAAVVVDQR